MKERTVQLAISIRDVAVVLVKSRALWCVGGRGGDGILRLKTML